MAKLILILGGVRSGKSRFAQQLAARLGGDDVLFVATAEAGDAEMAQRIEAHRTSRPATWTTLEQSLHVAAALSETSDRHKVVLIDCLTLLVSNLLLCCGDSPAMQTAKPFVEREIEALLSSLARRNGVAIVVSGEVGMGVVPESSLGRLYRDLLGWSNQIVAARADSTYLMVAGLAMEVGRRSTTVEDAAATCMSAPDGGMRSNNDPICRVS